MLQIILTKLCTKMRKQIVWFSVDIKSWKKKRLFPLKSSEPAGACAKKEHSLIPWSVLVERLLAAVAAANRTSEQHDRIPYYWYERIAASARPIGSSSAADSFSNRSLISFLLAVILWSYTFASPFVSPPSKRTLSQHLRPQRITMTFWM